MANFIQSALSRYEYTLVEKRILFEVLSSFQKKKKFSLVKFLGGHVELRASLKAPADQKEQYLEALQTLRLKSFRVDDSVFGFVNGGAVVDNRLDISISHTIEPIIADFRRYNINLPFRDLIVLLSLQSAYSVHFYNFFHRQKNLTGTVGVSLEQLREILQLEDKYSQYGVLKQKVLNPCMEELAELKNKGESNIAFSFAEIKKGRQVIGLEFTFIRDQGNLAFEF